MIRKIIKRLLHYVDNSYFRERLVRLVTIDEFYANLQKIHPVPPEIITTPEVMKAPLHWRSEYLRKETYSLPPIYSAILRDAIYSPRYSTVITHSRKVVSDSINTDFFKDSKRFSILHLFSEKVEKLSGVYSVFRSTNNSYYHTLIDNIPRLYLLAQSEYSQIPRIKLLFSSEPTETERFFNR